MAKSSEGRANFTEIPLGAPGRVYRSCMPFSKRYDAEGTVLDAARAAGVRAVVMLVDDQECDKKSSKPGLRAEYERLGWAITVVAIPDFGVPADAEPFARAVTATTDRARAGDSVLVHCHAGVGRTGTFLACVKRALDPSCDGAGAIRWVKRYVPGAVETEGQKRVVHEFRSSR